jgi:phage gp45-like
MKAERKNRLSVLSIWKLALSHRKHLSQTVARRQLHTQTTNSQEEVEHFPNFGFLSATPDA